MEETNGDLSLKDKLERLGMRQKDGNPTQYAVAEGAQVNAGHLSSLLASDSKRKSLSPATCKRIAAYFGVPYIYFVPYATPKDYAGALITNMSPQQRDKYHSWSLHRKMFWILDDLEQKWGPKFSIAGISEWSGISEAQLLAMKEGRSNITPAFARVFSELTGLPIDVTVGAPELPDQVDLPPRIRGLAELLMLSGEDPDWLEEMLELLLLKRPTKKPAT